CGSATALFSTRSSRPGWVRSDLRPVRPYKAAENMNHVIVNAGVSWAIFPPVRIATAPVHAQGSAAASPTRDANGVTAPEAYRIGPEDMLLISVWKNEALTRQVPVRPDGKISLPLLNDVQAGGLTPAQLRADITQRLKKYFTDPRVTVIVTTIGSQRIYLMGEVTRAGAYPLLPGMNLLQA